MGRSGELEKSGKLDQIRGDTNPYREDLNGDMETLFFAGWSAFDIQDHYRWRAVGKKF